MFLAALVPSVALALGEHVAGGKRFATVRDTIEMTRWADRDYFLGADPGDRVGAFSPDASQFIVVVRKGNIRRNTNEFSLLLFQTRRAFQSARPRVLLTMSSRSNRDAISHVRWLSDGSTITFVGENLTEVSQVFALDTRGGILTAMTHHRTPVLAYDIDASGKTIVYEAARATESDAGDARPGGVVIRNQSPTDLVAYDCRPSDALGPDGAELFIQVEGRPARRIASSDFLTPAEILSVSPRGRYALLSAYVKDIPASWHMYADHILQGYISELRRPGTRSNLRRYMLLDTVTDSLTPLIDTPISGSSRDFRWTKDGNSIVLSGAYLPIDTDGPVERELRMSKKFIVEVMLPNKELVEITRESMRIENLNLATGRLLLTPVNPAGGLAAEVYEKSGPVWKRVFTSDVVGPEGVPLTVKLDEDMNTAPKIFVSDRATKRRSLLLDLNPQFEHLALGRVEIVRWKSTDGNEFEGGLYLPPDYRPGIRYPLVIQTHGFQQNRFWIDGPWSSAFAAQPLAATGMIVLQVGDSVDPSQEKVQTPSEAPVQMAAYEGAIDELDRRGLVDRTRVGMIGFSRTVYYVEYTLTHSKYVFRAATLADGLDGGYVNYILWPAEDYPSVNGGPAFGPSLTQWLQNSPGFNLDRITTPVHIEYYGRAGFLGGWQWYSGLSLLGKPVDYMWIPDGTHLLVKPSERMASQQGSVDWFRFWLLGEEDSDPTKKQQYQEWENLRALRDVQKATVDRSSKADREAR